jgi:transcriptional regulator with XRE-family HTH domain
MTPITPPLTGADLRARRRAAGLTQPDLAAAVGLHRESISRYERAPDDPVPRPNALALLYVLEQAEAARPA